MVKFGWLQQDRQGAGDGPCIQDDDDGHLIYQAGDILQARCTHIS